MQKKKNQVQVPQTNQVVEKHYLKSFIIWFLIFGVGVVILSFIIYLLDLDILYLLVPSVNSAYIIIGTIFLKIFGLHIFPMSITVGQGGTTLKNIPYLLYFIRVYFVGFIYYGCFGGIFGLAREKFKGAKGYFIPYLIIILLLFLNMMSIVGFGGSFN